MPRRKAEDEEGNVFEEPILADEVQGATVVCEECKDTGAVPANIEDGKVTKYKDCPKCYRYELKDANGAPTGEVRRLIGVDYD